MFTFSFARVAFPWRFCHGNFRKWKWKWRYNINRSFAYFLDCGLCSDCEDCIDFVCVLSNSSKMCASATGPCGTTSYCDGVSPNCTIQYLPSTTLCRAANDTCDAPDYCSGTSEACPNTFKLNGEHCANATTTCEADSYCNGVSTSCPTHAVLPSGTVCLSQCQTTLTCDGSSNTCPSPPAPGYCSGNGVCTADVCECSSGFTGSLCNA